MGYSQVLSVGDKIILEKKSQSDDSVKEFKSVIQDFLDDDQIVILTPIEKARYIMFPVGDTFDLNFQTKAGLYRCSGEVVNFYKEKAVHVTVVKFTSALEKYQRREYFRLEYIKEIYFHEIIVPDETVTQESAMDETMGEITNVVEELPQAEWKKAMMIDISGGGMRINSYTLFENAKRVNIKMTISVNNAEKELICQGDVIEIRPIEKVSGLFEYRICYIDISKFDRENIVRFIFEEERRRKNANRR